MKPRIIIVSSVIGLIAGAVIGFVLASIYADANPWMRVGDNAIGIPLLACIIGISSAVVGASVGNIIADIREKGMRADLPS